MYAVVLDQPCCSDGVQCGSLGRRSPFRASGVGVVGGNQKVARRGLTFWNMGVYSGTVIAVPEYEEKNDKAIFTSPSFSRKAARSVTQPRGDPSGIASDTLPKLRPRKLPLCEEGRSRTRSRLLSDGHGSSWRDASDLRSQRAPKTSGEVGSELPSSSGNHGGDLYHQSEPFEERQAIPRRLGAEDDSGARSLGAYLSAKGTRDVVEGCRVEMGRYSSEMSGRAAERSDS